MNWKKIATAWTVDFSTIYEMACLTLSNIKILGLKGLLKEDASLQEGWFLWFYDFLKQGGDISIQVCYKPWLCIRHIYVWVALQVGIFRKDRFWRLSLSVSLNSNKPTHRHWHKGSRASISRAIEWMNFYVLQIFSPCGPSIKIQPSLSRLVTGPLYVGFCQVTSSHCNSRIWDRPKEEQYYAIENSQHVGKEHTVPNSILFVLPVSQGGASRTLRPTQEKNSLNRDKKNPNIWQYLDCWITGKTIYRIS